MRFGLRWKILLFTAVVPVALALGTLWTVNHKVSSHLEDSIYESLRRSSRVFENMISARANALEVAAQVIVRDPRFFSILTLSGSPTDPQYRATVRGVAHDFHQITHSDLFEVVDRQGRLIASVGDARSSARGRGGFVRDALRGASRTGLLIEGDRHYQVTVTPVLAGGKVVGALMIGAGIGGPLATRLRALTHSEVTFVSGDSITGSTLIDAGDRDAILGTLGDSASRPDSLHRESILNIQAASGTYVSLIRAIPGSRFADRQLYVMQRSLVVESAFLERVRGALVELGLLAMLAAVGMGFLVSVRITRPVQRLVRGAEEMERGNYDYPLNVRSHDEIGYLAERFEEMRQREKNYVGSLEEVARLKTEFITIASHELRTPISVIKGFVELFSQGSLGETSERQREALAAIERSLKHLTRIAEDATRVAQIESERLSLSYADHTVDTIVRQAVGIAAGDAPNRNLSLMSEVAPELGTVHADGQRLVQALANLVRNGIRYTPDGGRIEVRAFRGGDDVVLEVKDSGIGIEENRLKTLFTRSATSRDSLHHHSSSTLEFNSAGIGLGLTLAKGIVEAHGGTLAVESRLGEGSTFTIRVPIDGASRVDEAA
jgi:signal transduction histidine kinase